MSLSYGTGGGGDYKRIPPGSHIAVCDIVADVGLQESAFYGTKRKVYVRFEVPAERWEFEKDGKKGEGPGVIGKFFTASMHKNATLRKTLESWRSRPFTDEEAKAFDVSSILGKSCVINVQENPDGDKVYSNIVAITPLIKGMAQAKAELPLMLYTPDSSIDVYNKLPEWIRKMIDNQVQPQPKQTETAPSAEWNDPGPMQEQDDGYISDDDIPF